jgi:plasmid recombination enzyme
MIFMPSYISFDIRKRKTVTNGLARHNERQPGMKHTNSNIKNDRTKDNITLVTSDLSYPKRIEKIIDEQHTSKRKVRHDAVRLITTTVELGGDIRNKPEKEQIEFLMATYDYLKNEYGENNIAHASIHVDETCPHLHFDFVPIKDGSLNARSVVGNKKDMKTTQNKLLKTMQDKFPQHDFKRKNATVKGIDRKIWQNIQDQKKKVEAEINEKISNFNRNAKIKLSELNEKEQKLISYANGLKEREGRLNASEDEFKNKQDNFELYQKNTVKKLKDKETQLNQRSEDLVKNEAKQDKKELMLKEREIELNQYQERLKKEEKENEEKEKEIEYKQTLLKSKELRNEREHERREDELERREQALTTKEDTIKSTLNEFKELINEQKLTLKTVEEYEEQANKFADSFEFAEDEFVNTINALTKNKESRNDLEL